MEAPHTAFGQEGPLDRPKQKVVAAAARLTPIVLIALAVAGLLLGGSPWVSLALAVAAAPTLIPAFRRWLPRSHQSVIAAWIALLSVSVPLMALSAVTYHMTVVAGTALILLTRVIPTVRTRRLMIATIVVVQALGWVAMDFAVDAIWSLLVLLVAAIGSESTSAVNRSIVADTADRVRALSDERRSLIRLYEIASSIGASTTKAEAFPDLLGSIGDALAAQTCAIALLDENEGKLRLTGPLWVSGSAIPVDDDVVIAVSEGDFAARAMRSPRAVRFDRTTVGPFRSIIDDLGITEGLAAPLRLEGKASGLIVVGDPVGEEFAAQAIEMLTDLSVPAGLVLAQVGRHEAAMLLAGQLKEIAEMKSDLVSMVSHELRTPLTSVIGSLDLLATDPGDEELSGELLVMARRQALRLKRLIDDLLTVSRIDRNLVRPDPEPVDLAEVVDDAVWLVDESEVRVTIPEGLTAIADASHLSQVLTNLVENAAKYAPGSPIELAAGEAPDGRVVVVVVDHGPGIPEAERSRVFERFVRLPGTAATGTGLGLAIVAMLVEGMNGRIDVLDTPGGGATFAVTLPSAGRSRGRSAA